MKKADDIFNWNKQDLTTELMCLSNPKLVKKNSKISGLLVDMNWREPKWLAICTVKTGKSTIKSSVLSVLNWR